MLKTLFNIGAKDGEISSTQTLKKCRKKPCLVDFLCVQFVREIVSKRASGL